MDPDEIRELQRLIYLAELSGDLNLADTTIPYIYSKHIRIKTAMAVNPDSVEKSDFMLSFNSSDLKVAEYKATADFLQRENPGASVKLDFAPTMGRVRKVHGESSPSLPGVVTVTAKGLPTELYDETKLRELFQAW